MPRQVILREVLVLYPYAAEKRDAVAQMVRDLVLLLGTEFDVSVLPGRNRELRQAEGSLAGAIRKKLGRHVFPAIFFVRAVMSSMLRWRRLVAVISVDVPAGIRLAGMPARILSRNRVRLVSWVLDMYSLQVLRKESGFLPRNTVRALLDDKGLRSSSDIVTLGQCMADAIYERSGHNANVIPIWREPMPIPKSTLRTRFGLSEETFVVLYSGTAGPNHPLGSLIRATLSLAPLYDVVLLVVGRGSEITQGRSVVEAAVAPNVYFFDPVEESELPALLASADLHVAVLDERMTGTCVPSKAYAAMAAGKPCLFLGSEDCQVARDIDVGGGGSVVRSDDTRRIALEMEKYLKAPELATQQGELSLEFLLTNRSRESARRQWVSVLRK